MDAVICILFSFDRKHVLLTKRRDIPVWVLPGGGIEPGEAPEAAACREASEETGFKVKISRKIAVYSPVNRLSKITHFYEVIPLSGTPSIGQETQAIEFFPIETLPKLIPPPHVHWIADACLNLKETLYKPIEGTSYWMLLKLLVVHPILIIRFLLTKVGIHINSGC